MKNEKEKTQPWVPMAKDATQLLPEIKAYTRLEALYSLQVDHNENKPMSINRFATQWHWSHNKVRYFLRDLNLRVVYPCDTITKQHQCGTLKNRRTDNEQIDGQITFIDFNSLQSKKDRSLNRYWTDKPRRPAPDGAFQSVKKENYKNKDNTYTSSGSEEVSSCVSNTITAPEVIALYHEILPELPQVKAWTAKRDKALNARIKEDPRREGSEWWKVYFRYIHESDFLMGRIDRGTWPGPDLEWLLNENNMTKIREGRYHGRK
jgi:hypothetical protein